MPRQGVLLTVAYDGRSFAGFARQEHARTVASELEAAIRIVDPDASAVRCASRTDAGVHARGQVVAFDTSRVIDSRGWTLALGNQLPDEISVVRAAHVAPGFEPRRRAVQKTYRYLVLRSNVRDPFWAGRAWRVSERLNQQAMTTEAESLLGEHDFTAFRGSADTRVSTVRRILRVSLRTASGDPRITELELTGNAFLYHMMRIIVGTLVDLGRGRIRAGAIAQALHSGKRSDLGMTAPPDGLYLEQVELDVEGHAAWP